jgi:hypothetical protein
MAILKIAYPAFYHRQTDDDIKLAISLWAEMFADDAAGDVAVAVKSRIANDAGPFPPSIGAIKARVKKLQSRRGWDELFGFNSAPELPSAERPLEEAANDRA